MFPSLMRTRANPRMGKPKDPWEYEDHFLSFVHHTLLGKSPRLSLEEGEPRAIWKDTVVRVKKMMSRACVRYLLYQGGWRSVEGVDDIRDKLKYMRMWHYPDFQDLSLQFSDEAVSLLVALFDYLRVTPTRSEGEPALVKEIRTLGAKVQSNQLQGDSFALHLVTHAILPLLDMSYTANHKTIADILIRVSQFNQIAFLEVDVPLSEASVSSFVAAWGWCMPWIGERISEPWVQFDQVKLDKDLDRFTQTVDKVKALLFPWATACLTEGRHDWMLPVLRYFKYAYPEQDYEPQLQRLTRFCAELKISRRQAIRDGWAELLGLMDSLNQVHDGIHLTAPVDRSPSEQLYLSWWEDMGMATTVTVVANLKEQLERVVG